MDRASKGGAAAGRSEGSASHQSPAKKELVQFQDAVE